MAAKKQIDYILLVSVLFLILLGLIMIFSVSASASQEAYKTSFYFLKHQLIVGFLPGIILGFIFFKIKISHLKKLAPFLYFLNIVLLLMVFLPHIGINRGGARRWIDLGIISFQPAELLKITLCLYLASWLQVKSRGKKAKDIETLFCFWLILLPLALALLFQPNLSSLFLLILIAFFMYFLAEAPFWQTILSAVCVFCLIFFLINIMPHSSKRLQVFFNPETDPMGSGYQVKQSLIAIGSGGVFGKGLGMSKQKFGFLPNPMSDSIFSVFCEETGIIGPTLLISLFMIFLIRGLKMVSGLKDEFYKLFGLGLVLQIVLQAFLNISSLTALLPLTGTPLPFISYGGSHIVVEMISLGILLNISKSGF